MTRSGPAVLGEDQQQGSTQPPGENPGVVTLSRRSIVVTAGVLVVLCVLGFVLGYVVAPARYRASHAVAAGSPKATTTTTAPRAPGVGKPLSVGGTIDTFSGADPSSLGSFGKAQAWRAVTGVWGTTPGFAYVSKPAPGASIALTDLGSGNGSVQVRMARIVERAALIFRYQDPLNYWYVAAVPAYGSWSIVKVIGGKQHTVANTGLSPVVNGTTVAVSMQGPTIKVALDGVVDQVVSDSALSGATMVGMGVAGPGAGQVRFSDFRAAPSSGQAPPAATTSP